MLDFKKVFRIRLDRFDRNLTARLIRRYLNNNQEGFTLVELIVVVVIIGILSAIAIPSFQNAGDKAKQKEASVLISSYLKGTQAYFSEYSMLPNYSRDLGQYISVTGCRRNYPTYCRSNPARDYTNLTSRSWTTPSGYFDIYMEVSGNNVYFRALPVPVYASSGFGVTSCFNSQTGATKVVERTIKGRGVPRISC